MTPIKIRAIDCIQCGTCESACLYSAIYMDEYPVIEQERCLLCKNCIEACPLGLITLEETPRKNPALPDTQTTGIWVLAEFRSGLITSVTYGLLGAARRLAGTTGEEVSVLLIGTPSPGEEEALIAAGADQVYIAQSSYRTYKTEEVHADIVTGLVHRFHPNILLVGATHFGRGVAARTASMLHTGLTADCIQLEIDPLSGRLLQIRPAFGGNLLATIETPYHRPQMASIRPGVMKAPEPDHNRRSRIIRYNVDHLITHTQVEILAEEIISSCFSVTDASILIAGGKGMQSKENIRLLYELADLLGGQVAASRAAVEAGWLPYECQVGQTGKTVRPRLYIACGISGQAQHVVSISEAGTVIAINNDVHAPIFHYDDYGMVGDITEIVPALIKELKMKKKEAEIY